MGLRCGCRSFDEVSFQPSLFSTLLLAFTPSGVMGENGSSRLKTSGGESGCAIWGKLPAGAELSGPRGFMLGMTIVKSSAAFVGLN